MTPALLVLALNLMSSETLSDTLFAVDVTSTAASAIPGPAGHLPDFGLRRSP